MDYSHKVVIITGAAGGIGRVLVEAYAHAGAIVIAADIINYPGPLPCSSEYMFVDLSKSDTVRKLFTDVKQKYAHIHILINNGAISGFKKDITEISDDEFETVISTNLNGTFFCSRAFIEANKDEDYGRIINIASTRFNQNEAGWEAYGASKGGVVSLTSAMAISLGNVPITVNAISPGWIETINYEALSVEDHLQHPSRRVGKPEDIARVCMFLTDKANDFINGENIVVDGGMTKKMIYI